MILNAFSDAGALAHVNWALRDIVKDVDPRDLGPILPTMRVKLEELANAFNRCLFPNLLLRFSWQLLPERFLQPPDSLWSRIPDTSGLNMVNRRLGNCRLRREFCHRQTLCESLSVEPAAEGRRPR